MSPAADIDCDGGDCQQPHQHEVKHPQVRQDHPQVMPGTAQQRVHRITEDAFELVSSQQAVGLHVADDRLDCKETISIQPKSCRSRQTFILFVSEERRRSPGLFRVDHLHSVSAVQPILQAIDSIAAHCGGY